MSVTNHVSISITTDSVGVARQEFGLPLFLSYSAAGPARVKTYSDIAGVTADFADATSPERLAAAAWFNQNPHGDEFLIGRGALPPTQVYELTPTASNSTDYVVTVAGEGVTTTTVTFTSDASATVAEITAGLETLISAVVGNNYAVVDNSTSLTITADAAGNWFSIAVGNPALLQNEQTHVDPGIATDLVAIELESDTYYCLLTAFNSNAMVLAAATHIESRTKIYVVDVPESDAVTTTVGNSDTLDDLATATRARTAGIYHPSPQQMNAVGWAGVVLPKAPGSATWKFKRPTGVATLAPQLTSTQRANLVARNANFLEGVGSLAFMSEGTMADGGFIDTKRGLDFLQDDMSARILEVLAGSDKVPFTDPGIAQVEEAIRAALKNAVTLGILAEDPEFVVTVPKAADVSTINKTNRLLPDMKFSATLAGAVHKVIVTGVVSV